MDWAVAVAGVPAHWQVKQQELDMLTKLDWKVDFKKPHDFITGLLPRMRVPMTPTEQAAVQRHAEIFVDMCASRLLSDGAVVRVRPGVLKR